MDTATARERSVFGTHREMTLFMHGSATPSPKPMTARTASSAPKLPLVATKGVTNVASDHTAIPNPRTIFPPYLSASTPPMSGVRAYPHRNELCTKPTARSPQPFAAAKGTPATDMITLSALHSMRANATNPTTTNRYALALAPSLVAVVAPSAPASTRVPRRRVVSPNASHPRLHPSLTDDARTTVRPRVTIASARLTTTDRRPPSRTVVSPIRAVLLLIGVVVVVVAVVVVDTALVTTTDADIPRTARRRPTARVVHHHLARVSLPPPARSLARVGVGRASIER